MRTESLWTIGAIRAANKNAGFYYFEPSAMRFFDSKIEPRVYQGDGGIFFVTSEQFHGSDGRSAPRKWSVCKFNPETGDVDRHGPFNEMDRTEAMRTAKRAARGETV
jgi:hypothetical protein